MEYTLQLLLTFYQALPVTMVTGIVLTVIAPAPIPYRQEYIIYHDHHHHNYKVA